MTDIRNTSDQFFGARNEAMLDRLLYADFQRRTGGDLSERQKERLTKTVRHYMQEVQASNPAAPVQLLNKEVLTAVVPDFMSYLRRTGPKEDSELQMDVSSRFDRLQQDRQGAVAMPTAPDFQVSLESDGPSPLSRFEEIKKIREAEALREAEVAAKHRSGANTTTSQELVLAPRDSSMNQFVDSDVSFKAMADAAKARDAEALGARGARPRPGELMPVPPDARQLFIGNGLPVPARTGQANPTLAMPTGIRDRPALAQDVIKPQEDIVSYRENEYNLYVYSADRDWVNNSTENRYNFSVNFDPANNKPGFGYSTATNIKFKNIVRIEFIKAIMPVESCDTLLVSNPVTGGGFIKSTDLNTNIFSYPYLQVRIPELDTNGYGTNDGLNRSFGVISFDGYWTSDSNAKNKGFARMIPKFLKCQKVFYPTPLATIQKLTFQTQKPDGSTVSDARDTLDVAGFTTSNNITPTSGQYYDSTGSWIWVQTPAYFNRFSVTQGDRVQFKNVVLDAASAAGAANGAADFVRFITREQGHLVSDIGCFSASIYSAGPNEVGYANCVIIKNNFVDPTTGSTDLVLWGGSVATNTAFTGALLADKAATGRFINLNHQIQIILRVITRDMDAAARLRPDNLQA
jgi:hypothetical protein